MTAKTEKKDKEKEKEKKKVNRTRPINTIKKNAKERIQENLELIIQLRKEGNTIEYIARAIGICRATLYQHLNENPELMEALARGQYEYNAELKKSCMQRAVGYKIELKKVRKEYKHDEYGDKHLIKETVDVEEKYIYSDLLAYKLLSLDKYNNVDDVPPDLKELFEKYNRKVENED